MTYRLKKLATYARGRVLDVGFSANPNPFLKGEVVGMDIAPAAKPENYHQVVVYDAEKLSEYEERFDTVIAGEMIEHLRNPISFLEGTFQVLNPGGRLVLSTPNPYHPPIWLLETLMFRKYYYDEGHLNLFLPRFLARLIERQGFERVQVKSGGIGPPFVSFEIPSPRAICEALIYIGEKGGA